MTPDYRIIAKGSDITSIIRARMTNLTVIDEVALKSDQFEVTLNDSEGAIKIPAPGATLEVSLGYKETGLVTMGLYVVDEITMQSPPNTMTIRAKAADLSGALKTQRTRGWDDITIGALVDQIAHEHSLTSKVADVFKGIAYKRLDQSNEGDLNFLARLAEDLDAIAALKSQTLVFAPRAAAQTANGAPLPTITLAKSDMTSWSMTRALRGAFGTVEAHWHDEATGLKERVSVGTLPPVVARQKFLHLLTPTFAANQFSIITRFNPALITV